MAYISNLQAAGIALIVLPTTACLYYVILSFARLRDSQKKMGSSVPWIRASAILSMIFCALTLAVNLYLRLSSADTFIRKTYSNLSLVCAFIGNMTFATILLCQAKVLLGIIGGGRVKAHRVTMFTFGLLQLYNLVQFIIVEVQTSAYPFYHTGFYNPSFIINFAMSSALVVVSVGIVLGTLSQRRVFSNPKIFGLLVAASIVSIVRHLYGGTVDGISLFNNILGSDIVFPSWIPLITTLAKLWTVTITIILVYQSAFMYLRDNELSSRAPFMTGAPIWKPDPESSEGA